VVEELEKLIDLREFVPHGGADAMIAVEDAHRLQQRIGAAFGQGHFLDAVVCGGLFPGYRRRAADQQLAFLREAQVDLLGLGSDVDVGKARGQDVRHRDGEFFGRVVGGDILAAVVARDLEAAAFAQIDGADGDALGGDLAKRVVPAKVAR